MYSADEIYDTAELDNIPSIPDQHFTDIDLDNFEDDEDLEPTDNGNDEGDDYNNAPVYPMPFFKPDNKPDETDEDLEPNQDDEDLEPSDDDDDFGGSFPLSVEYDDDLPEPTYIDHGDDDWF
jgi:hypothetical protein